MKTTYAKIEAPKFEDDYHKLPHTGYMAVGALFATTRYPEITQFFRRVSDDGWMVVSKEEATVGDWYQYGIKDYWYQINPHSTFLANNTSKFRRHIHIDQRIEWGSEVYKCCNICEEEKANTHALYGDAAPSPETKPLKDGEEAGAKCNCWDWGMTTHAHDCPANTSNKKEPTITLTESQLHLLMADYLLYNQTHGDMNNREWLTNYRKEKGL